MKKIQVALVLAALAVTVVAPALAGPATAGLQKEQTMTTDTATFAAGCFWGVQAAFDEVKGVVSTTVGYTGGHTEKPTYPDVCSDTTGHAEALQIVFDPQVVTYDQLLDTFWSIHDPTTPNRQGPDVGTQYRSVIFYHGDTQHAAAVASRDKLAKSGKYRRPIVTEIVPASVFWPAEEYHQKYFQKHGGGSCHIH
jgi:peptide-methionine (S)-S-oxide reductase